MAAERPATVWASTWVPSPAPVEGFGAEGYAVCWADLDQPDTCRVQVLVAGPAPAPGTAGRIVQRQRGGEAVEVFVPDPETAP